MSHTGTQTTDASPTGEAPPRASTIFASRDAGPVSPMSLPQLAASLVFIVFAALAIASLVAIIALLVLYAEVGGDGLSALYQDLRFDPAFKTEVGAVVVGAFYASAATATIGLSRWYGGSGWRNLIAWLPARGRPRTIIFIFTATLLYASSATLLLTLTQHRPVINIGGPTNFLLLGTFVANLVVLAPCAEELFFRGWLYTGLRARLPFWVSLAMTVVVFASIHLDLHRPRVLLVLPLAVATCVVRELTGSVKPAIALHMAYNLVIVTVKLWET